MQKPRSLVLERICGFRVVQGKIGSYTKRPPLALRMSVIISLICSLASAQTSSAVSPISGTSRMLNLMVVGGASASLNSRWLGSDDAARFMLDMLAG